MFSELRWFLRISFITRILIAFLIALIVIIAVNSNTAAASWKFVVYGDTRTDDSAHRSVLRSIAQNTPDYRFIINVGDVVADGTSGSQWDTWQRSVNDELGGSGQGDIPPKYMAVPGNHDNLDSSSGLSNWKKYLPGQQRYGNNGAFFVLDYQDVRIIFMNSDASITGSQRDMLREAVDKNPQKWLFAVWHHPIFPFGAKPYEDGIHDNWGVPLHEAGADIIFTGHAHYYARSKKLALDGREHPPEDPAYGTAQVITGNGGAPPYEVDAGSNAYMLAGSTVDYGYTELTVDGDTLYLRHITHKGAVIDAATYTPNPKSVAAESCSGCANALSTNETLTTGEWLESSNGQYRLYLQGDGNLVLRDHQTSEALWAAGTNGKGATHLVLQSDNNLVLYTAANAPVWASNTVGSGATELKLNDDGLLVLYKGTSVVWSVPSSSNSGGKIQGKQGSFSWNGTRVDYISTGGLTNGGTKQTPAKAGDYEIVSFGASHGGGSGKVNEYFDANKMNNQGFQAIAVRGEEDKKVEMWIRKNSGQSSIDIPADARAYDFLVLDGHDIQLELANIEFKTIDSAGDPYQVPVSAGDGLKVLSYFSDDSAELTDVGNGTLVFQEWGFGDGDGFATAFFAPGTKPPGNIDITYHDGGGRQYVGIMATYEGSPADGGDGSGDGTGDDDGGDTVDAGTLNNKIMAGYQGWFNAEGDGAGKRWRHWGDGSGNTPNPDNITFDMWPDLREYDADELYATDFKYSNGSNAGLYSAYTPKTVERHLKWMQDYGIDGVFVQRFIGEATGSFRGMRDRVLQNVRAGAEKYGRVFANMYDISGGNAGSLVDDIKNDWIHLVDDLGITASSRYLHHNGRPVLSIWGFNCNGRPGSASQARDLFRWLTTDAPAKYRVTLKLGVDDDWRSDSADWQAAYRSADIISPWAVGRYVDNSGADNFRNKKIAPDFADLNSAGIDYMPVVFPGFSWWNLKGEKYNHIKRNGGRFFWRQFYNAINAGCRMIYVAMFDEVDEGTAIYKVAENDSQTPTTGRFVTLDEDGEDLPSDWYLRLTGEATKMLRSQIGLTAAIPISPNDPGSDPNQKPIAEAGSDQSVTEGKAVTLNGGSSSDPDGSIVAYLWEQTAGTPVTLSNADASKARFVAPYVGQSGERLTFRITVTDNGGLTDSDTCLVEVARETFSDSDGDGVPDDRDEFPYNADEYLDTDGDGEGNNADTDDDNDGMPDDWELAHGLNPLENDADEDLDDDDVSNINEFESGTDPNYCEGNLKPNSPSLLMPENGATVGLRPQFETGDFSDPNDNDGHSRTQWLVTRAFDGVCVLDISSSSALTLLTLPKQILEEDTEYFWKARFIDNHNMASEWSEEREFVTGPAEHDIDKNGVPDVQEVPDTLDLDADGTFDVDQTDIKCVSMPYGDEEDQVCISTKDSQNIESIVSLEVEDPADPDLSAAKNGRPNYFEFGLIDFKLLVSNPGDVTTVTIYLSRPAYINGNIFKYDPVDEIWLDYSGNTEFSSSRRKISLTLRDGGFGDADGIENGIIVDPLAFGSETDPSGGSADNIVEQVVDGILPNNLGCFITTAKAGLKESTPWSLWQEIRGRELALLWILVMLGFAARKFIAGANRSRIGM